MKQETATPNQQSAPKPVSSPSKKRWIPGVAVAALALGVAGLFAVYAFLSAQSRSPLKLRAGSVSVQAGSSFKFNVALINQTQKQIKIESLVMVNPDVEQRFSLNETNPQSTGAELVEKEGDTPRSMNYEYSPPITVAGGKTEQVLVEGEAYQPGLYTLNILADIRIEGFDLASYFGKKPSARTKCTIKIYPKTGGI